MAALENMMNQMKSMPASQKTGLLAITVVSVAAIALLLTWIQKADYQLLYANLSEDDAGKIVQELKDRRIPYQLSSSGTVLVPSDKVYDLRLQLATEGLPQGAGVGFEIFDKTTFTTSEFVQKLNYKRALEGELSRTIKSLSAIQQGRVHLVLPDRTVFAFQEDKPKASAAVFITLEKGRKLNPAEVEGIVHLVSSSVQDLIPEDITVIDNKGRLLTRPSDDSMMAMSGSQLEFQTSYEKSMMSKIVSILEPVVGRGKVNARVSTTFDFTRSERTQEFYDPDGVVVRSEQTSTEKTTSGARGGVPGVAANLPGGGAQPVTSSAGQSQKKDETINYETSKTITRIVDSPVSLEKLSVAILIDGILPAQKDTMENAEQFTVRSEEDIKYYEDIIKKTVGFSEERGDEISVTVMPFENEVVEVAQAEKNYMPLVLTILKYTVPVIVALLFFLFIVKPIVSSLTRAIPQRSTVTARAEETGDEVSQLQTKEIPMEKQVIDWASNNTQQATGLVKGWIEEG